MLLFGRHVDFGQTARPSTGGQVKTWLAHFVSQRSLALIEAFRGIVCCVVLTVTPTALQHSLFWVRAQRIRFMEILKDL